MGGVVRFLKGFDLTLTLSGRRTLSLSLASHFKSSQRRGETHSTLLHTIDAEKNVSDARWLFYYNQYVWEDQEEEEAVSDSSKKPFLSKVAGLCMFNESQRENEDETRWTTIGNAYPGIISISLMFACRKEKETGAVNSIIFQPAAIITDSLHQNYHKCIQTALTEHCSRKYKTYT